jgi:integrase
MPRISQPREGEPIRVIHTQTGPRYRTVLDTAPPGTPRRQVTRTFGTLGEARAYIIETRHRIAQGTYTAPDRITLRQLADNWLASRRDIREVTVNGYRNALRPAVDQLGNRPVQSLTRRDIDELVDWCTTSGGQHGTGLAHRSVSYLLVTLRMLLNYAVSSGIVPANVAAGVKPPRRKADDHKARTLWTVPQMLAFRAVADTDPWAVGMRLILCGLRRSEVCGLRWEHVDLDAGTVTVAASRVVVGKDRTAADEPKSAASARVVPVERMHAGTVKMLRTVKAQQAAALLAAGGTGDSYVVADPYGNGVHPDTLTSRWRTLCARAGVPVVGTHSVRHVLATVLHQAGEAPADVAALLGHEVTTHLSVYVQRTDHGAGRAADAFAALAAVR